MAKNMNEGYAPFLKPTALVSGTRPRGRGRGARGKGGGAPPPPSPAPPNSRRKKSFKGVVSPLFHERIAEQRTTQAYPSRLACTPLPTPRAGHRKGERAPFPLAEGARACLRRFGGRRNNLEGRSASEQAYRRRIAHRRRITHRQHNPPTQGVRASFIP